MAIIGNDVSVIIPAYGDCPQLHRVICSLLTQTAPPGEILIVHSGPADPTPLTQVLDARIRTYHFDQRMYAGAARNFGMERASRKWAAFLDADVRPTSLWLAELLKAMDQGPQRFVVGSIGYAVTGGYWGLCLWSIEFSQMHPHLPGREIEGGASGNMLISMKDFQSAGGFPERMAASEDVLLFAALRRNGLTNWYCPTARGDHFNISGIRHYCRHLFSYGTWSSKSRRMMPLKGWVTIRIWPLSSFLWLLRFSIICCRAVRGGARHLAKSSVLIPGVLFGLLIWNAGYFKGIFENFDDRQP